MTEIVHELTLSSAWLLPVDTSCLLARRFHYLVKIKGRKLLTGKNKLRALVYDILPSRKVPESDAGSVE